MTRMDIVLAECKLSLAKFLDLSHFKACALVNWAWYHAFQPFVWEYFNASFPEFRDPSYANRIAWLNSVRNNACWIRRLYRVSWEESIDPELYEILMNYCHKLTSLEASAKHEQEWTCLWKLIQVNSRLTRLSFRVDGHDFYSLDDRDAQLFKYLKDMSCCRHIRDLTITCQLSMTETAQLLEICPSLENLTVGSLVFDGIDKTEKTDKTNRKRISLFCRTKKKTLPLPPPPPKRNLVRFVTTQECDIAALSALLDQCPSLQSLKLLSDLLLSGEIPREKLLSGRLQHLTTLYLGDLHKAGIRQRVIMAVQPQQLVHVVLRTPSTYELDLVLTNHYQSLECLKACPIQDSTPNAAKALFKCRKLRVLKLEAMDSMDVRYLIAQPWASQATLEDLQLPVGVRRQCRNKTMLKYASVEKEKLHLENPELEEWQQAEHLFMKRLGECTRLKYFSMRCATPWHPTLKEVDEGLSWQLSNGLMHLSSLACLERLDFDRTPFLLGMAELQFMQKHWPRLSVLRCVGIDSEEVRQWLQASWPTLYVYVVRLYNPQNPGFQHFETPPKGWWT